MKKKKRKEGNILLISNGGQGGALDRRVGLLVDLCFSSDSPSTSG